MEEIVCQDPEIKNKNFFSRSSGNHAISLSTIFLSLSSISSQSYVIAQFTFSSWLEYRRNKYQYYVTYNSYN